jgi:hypothetical protein
MNLDLDLDPIPHPTAVGAAPAEGATAKEL